MRKKLWKSDNNINNINFFFFKLNLNLNSKTKKTSIMSEIRPLDSPKKILSSSLNFSQKLLLSKRLARQDKKKSVSYKQKGKCLTWGILVGDLKAIK